MTTDSARALPALRPDRDTPQYGMKGGCTRRVMTTGEARGHGVMQRRRARAGQCRAGAAERTSPTIAKQRICSTRKPSRRSQPARCRAARPGPRRLARKPRPAPTTTANPQVSGPRRNAQGQILRRSESCSANGRVIQLPHICALVPLGFTSASAADSACLRFLGLALPDERLLRAHHAELVSLGVSKDGQGLSAGLPDVCMAPRARAGGRSPDRGPRRCW
jgi:hypothetical protein